MRGHVVVVVVVKLVVVFSLFVLLFLLTFIDTHKNREEFIILYVYYFEFAGDF